MPHINYRDEKMVLKLRSRHMPTREIKPKGGKGSYDRKATKAEMDELLNEMDETMEQEMNDLLREENYEDEGWA